MNKLYVYLCYPLFYIGYGFGLLVRPIYNGFMMGAKHLDRLYNKQLKKTYDEAVEEFTRPPEKK